MVAFNAVMRVANQAGHLGCAVLVGIDRILLPLHLLAGECLTTLHFILEKESEECCLPALSFRARDILFTSEEAGCCLVQLAPLCTSEGNLLFPGQVSKVPALCLTSSSTVTLQVHVNEEGQKVLSLADSCSLRSAGFCSYHPTVPGSSGGGLFTLQGFTALHQARSSGLCSPRDERVATTLASLVCLWPILTLSPCFPLCPSSLVRSCLPPAAPSDPCYEEEGGLKGRITHWETQVDYREVRKPGGGHRGIQATVTLSGGRRFTYCLDINENPHSVAAYNKNQAKFYQEAAKAIAENVKADGTLIAPTFTVFKETFTTTATPCPWP